MNNRIQELADQVGLGIKHNGIILTKNVNAAEAFEKFAQLIVQECAKTIQDFVDHRLPASEYPERLKEYFGDQE